MKSEDYHYFFALLNEEHEEEFSPKKHRECKIMKLLLKMKNGHVWARCVLVILVEGKMLTYQLFNDVDMGWAWMCISHYGNKGCDSSTMLRANW
jgi:hypothetical protein